MTPFQRNAKIDQILFLTQSAMEIDRSDVAQLNADVRAARSELERLQRQKRAAEQAQQRATYYMTPATFSAQSGQASYYRTYPYGYAQAYAPSAIPPGSVSTFSVQASPTPSNATASASASSSATASNSGTATTSSGTVPGVPHTGAIPVQLPVAFLPALHSAGIVPVSSSAVSAGQPPPAALLKGQSQNGTVLQLEINVGLLQPHQMSGLAMILNSLVTRAPPAVNPSASKP